MSDTVLITLIVAATIVLVILLLRGQLSRFLVFSNHLKIMSLITSHAIPIPIRSARLFMLSLLFVGYCYPVTAHNFK